VPAWRIAGVKSVASRFEALRPELTGFVGRQTELQQIEALWEKAKHGNGQIVEILGEAGIGKSRLIKIASCRRVLARRAAALTHCRNFLNLK
jgi:predicted ATPase